jgi:hypothetical protein
MSNVNVTVTYPASGNVSGSGTFTTYGNYTVTPTMNATPQSWITNASTGATVATGTATTPPAGYAWAFKYSGVGTGVPYVENVNVTATDGGSNTQQVNITCTSP